MNFDLDDEARQVAAAARTWFADHAGPDHLRRALDTGQPPAPGLAGIAEMGFLGITVPESVGGAGRTLLDLAVVAEQGGRALAGPSLVTPARVAVLLADRGELLAALADGSTAYAVLDGSVAGSHPSLDAASASVFLALDGAAVVLGPGTARCGAPMDPSRGLAAVRLDASEVVVPDARRRWEHARQVACVVLAAEDLGAAERAVEMGVEYAKVRQAFNRPIGSYQAVKHSLVDAFVQVEQLRSLVWWAAWAADAAPDALPLAASAAKAYASDTLERAAEALIQVHGGIGFTWEHDAHLYWRRAKVDRLLLGDATAHRDAVARIALRSIADDPERPPPGPSGGDGVDDAEQGGPDAAPDPAADSSADQGDVADPWAATTTP